MDINKIILIGRLVKDAELKYIAGSGTPVATFKIAVGRKYNKEKENAAKADFIPILLWGKIAESISEYLVKGKQIAVEGRLQTRSYDKDGTKRYITEVVANEVQLLGSNGNRNENTNRNSGFDDMTPVDDGDIPF